MKEEIIVFLVSLYKLSSYVFTFTKCRHNEQYLPFAYCRYFASVKQFQRTIMIDNAVLSTEIIKKYKLVCVTAELISICTWENGKMSKIIPKSGT